MTGSEFLRKLRELARASGIDYAFEPAPGKGSHGRITLGSRSTTVKDRTKKIGPGLLSAMCKDLGIDPQDLTGK